MAPKPSSELARSILPGPLYRALRHVFAQGISDCMLVGGTALAGYYAGHRRSDDLDLFVKNAGAHKAAVLACQSLKELGAQVVELQHSGQFYSGSYCLDAHDFTVQAVLDENLFVIGKARVAGDGVNVTDLATLLKMKSSTLLSRCSEKDLYDLWWLFRQFPDLKLEDLIALGSEIDGAMNAETVLISVAGTTLNEAACGFSLSQDPAEVLADIQSLKTHIEEALDRVAGGQPAPRIGQLVKRFKRRRGKK